MTRQPIAAAAIVLALLLAACSSGGSGTSTTTRPNEPAAPFPKGPAALLASGLQHTFAPGPDGSLLAWGGNASGQLGDGSQDRANAPVKVTAIRGHGKIVQVDAGQSHSLALTSDGSVFAWGHNASGQLGDGSITDTSMPKKVPSLQGARAIVAGSSFSLALLEDGSVWAWGNNASGQLGDGNAPLDHNKPAMVYGLGPGSGAVAIAAGQSFGLVLKRDGSVLGWGNGTSGQLGDGTTSKQSAPTPVQSLGSGSGVIALSAGEAFSMVLKQDGSVWAWGNNQSGQLGDGTAPSDHHVPVRVKGLGRGSGAVAIATGNSFAYALLDDGSVMSWGNNQSGQIGNGKPPRDIYTPSLVIGFGAGSGTVAIAAGGSQCVLLKKSGELFALGNNSYGQLGDGKAPIDASTPVAVAPIS